MGKMDYLIIEPSHAGIEQLMLSVTSKHGNQDKIWLCKPIRSRKISINIQLVAS